MCCPKHKKLFLTLVVSFILSAKCDIEVQVLSKANPCEGTCDEAFPTSPANASRCRRGCRLLRLAHLTSPYGDGAASCRAACAEAHPDSTEQAACAMGCATPFGFPAIAQRQMEIVDGNAAEVQVSWAVYVQGGADVLPIQPDLEPDDLLTDPGLRRQLELGAEGLPQTHVRSMDTKIPPRRIGGDLAWCGLPPYANVLLVAIGCALALYLCVADSRTEQRALVKGDDVEKQDLLDLPPKYSESA